MRTNKMLYYSMKSKQSGGILFSLFVGSFFLFWGGFNLHVGLNEYFETGRLLLTVRNTSQLQLPTGWVLYVSFIYFSLGLGLSLCLSVITSFTRFKLLEYKIAVVAFASIGVSFCIFIFGSIGVIVSNVI
ncbi:hypothetical protein [Pseudoalteromonas xiamenensis]